ncbi:MAG TPA: hypothetical protein ENJ17_04775 [Gammaproteobacteria bacterium]|nr:hypothetical protein [Gammaproteobacteria bacterium]
MEVFYILNHWHWWALATLLLIAELLSPSAWFLALSLSALATGLVTWVMPELAGLVQLGIFLLLAAISVPYALMRLRRRSASRTTTDHSTD